MSAVLGRHAYRGRRPRLPAVARGPENDQAEVAAILQKTCRSWLVMWSRWRQKYTGFACFTPEPLIIDEARADRFLARIREVERGYRGVPVGRG